MLPPLTLFHQQEHNGSVTFELVQLVPLLFHTDAYFEAHDARMLVLCSVVSKLDPHVLKTAVTY